MGEAEEIILNIMKDRKKNKAAVGEKKNLPQDAKRNEYSKIKKNHRKLKLGQQKIF